MPTSGKLPTVIPGGRGITEQKAKPKYCSFCSKEYSQQHSNFWQCSGCNVVYYCDKICQRKHWGEHKVLCNALRTLSQNSITNASNRFVSHLTPKQALRIANLVGNAALLIVILMTEKLKFYGTQGPKCQLFQNNFLNTTFQEQICETSQN